MPTKRPKMSRNPELIFPWRQERFTKTASGQGTFSAKVRLRDRWHDVKFTMDLVGLKDLAALPRDRRIQMLEAMAGYGVRNNLIDRRPRPRGRNTEPVLKAMLTARWLAPQLRNWATEGKKTKNKVYFRVIRQMDSEDYEQQDAKGVAAFLTERNWRNAYQKWPIELRPPTEDPAEFFTLLKRNDPHLTAHKLPPKPLDEFVSDILDGREPCIIANPDIDGSLPITWF